MMESSGQLRQHALNLFQAGITAADPYQAVKKHLQLGDDGVEFSLQSDTENIQSIRHKGKIHIIAFGKAAGSMAKAAAEIVPAHLLASKPIAVTNYENKTTLADIELITANHPIPDAAGEKAAQLIADRLSNAQTDELVLVLISGGGSALLPYPAEGIGLQDKQATTDLLLASGASINQVNCVRKHLSQLKGGQMARLASPAKLHALILSDVLGDELSAIASGPTVPDNSTYGEAISILKDKNIWDKTPANVQQLLQNGENKIIPETPDYHDSCFKNTTETLIGSNNISLKAVHQAANTLNYATEIYSPDLKGEASLVAEQLVLHAKQLQTQLNKATAIIAGGETTVTLKGTGKGGRNQEMALAFAIAAEKHGLKHSWTFLSGGTDGRDGPTDAAGGIVDNQTLLRLKKKNINPEKILADNDSYSALKESMDLVMTGATGTNVADLQILLIQPE